jgi:hypothetical protein
MKLKYRNNLFLVMATVGVLSLSGCNSGDTGSYKSSSASQIVSETIVAESISTNNVVKKYPPRMNIMEQLTFVIHSGEKESSLNVKLENYSDDTFPTVPDSNIILKLPNNSFSLSNLSPACFFLKESDSLEFKLDSPARIDPNTFCEFKITYHSSIEESGLALLHYSYSYYDSDKSTYRTESRPKLMIYKAPRPSLYSNIQDHD